MARLFHGPPVLLAIPSDLLVLSARTRRAMRLKLFPEHFPVKSAHCNHTHSGKKGGKSKDAVGAWQAAGGSFPKQNALHGFFCFPVWSRPCFFVAKAQCLHVKTPRAAQGKNRSRHGQRVTLTEQRLYAESSFYRDLAGRALWRHSLGPAQGEARHGRRLSAGQAFPRSWGKRGKKAA